MIRVVHRIGRWNGVVPFRFDQKTIVNHVIGLGMTGETNKFEDGQLVGAEWMK